MENIMHICFRDYLPTIEIIVPAWRRIKFVTANKEYGFYYEETSSFCDNCLLDLTSWKILDFFFTYPERCRQAQRIQATYYSRSVYTPICTFLWGDEEREIFMKKSEIIYCSGFLPTKVLISLPRIRDC